jgi:hypothetical protein
MLTGFIDISRMCQCGPVGFDGPDYVGNEFIHHWKCFGVDSPGLVDSKRIFHVSIINMECGPTLTISELQQSGSSCMDDYQTSGLARSSSY